MSRFDNYESDHRVRALDKWYSSFDPKNMLLVMELFDDDTNEEFEASFPAKYEVCPTCHGKGQHVNPSIDSNGLSAEDFAEDPDFAEDYLSGVHDQTCNGCGGRTTVPMIDEDRLNDEQKKWMELRQKHLDFRAQCRAEEAAERRMGA